MEKVGFGLNGMEWLGIEEVGFGLFHKFVKQFEKKDYN
jgi:hypothetical protein